MILYTALYPRYFIMKLIKKINKYALAANYLLDLHLKIFFFIVYEFILSIFMMAQSFNISLKNIK